MPYTPERQKAFDTLNGYFIKLKQQNPQKINKLLEGMLVNPMEGGSRRRTRRYVRRY